MSSRQYRWVFRAPGESYIRSWILQRQSVRIRISSGRPGREKEIENYRVRSKKAAEDRCAELRRQQRADGWILAASEAKEEGGYHSRWSGIPVKGAPLAPPGDVVIFAHPALPAKRRVVDLITAVRAGDVDAARGYLAAGASPDQLHEQSISMLTLAAYHDHLEMLDVLLDAGASLSPPGAPPLEAAAARGHEYAVCRLVEAGADPEAMASALHAALRLWRPKIAKLLIELAADVNTLDKEGRYRPLDYALARGDHAMMRRLTERGACIGGLPEPPLKTFRMDDLFAAIDAGDVDRVRQLLDSGVRVKSKGFLEPRPLAAAAEKGHVDMVRLLLEAGADLEGSVHAAARGNHLEVARVLFDAGGLADDYDEEAATPLMTAAHAGFLDMTRLLVEQGADVDHRDSSDTAALIWAALRGHTAVYRFLRPLTRDAEILAESEKLFRRRRGKRRS
ncbi:MAG: ankyrin repeat domain-containing protein [Acidobacteriota bacterium]